MDVLIFAFLGTTGILVVLYIVALLVLFIWFKKFRWLISILLLVVLIGLHFPATNLMFGYLYSANTYTGSNSDYQDLPFESSSKLKVIPQACENISYDFTPANSWFACRINQTKFKEWSASYKFSPDKDIKCHSAREKPKEVFTNSEAIAMFSTPLNSKGAGKVAYYYTQKQQLLVCEWYW